MAASTERYPQEVGPVTVGPVAHGGHCVARYDGRVIFVRHALPGEVVRLRVTDTSHDRFWRGDATEILEPSPDRVAAPCAVAGPGLCGGCDFQHATLAAQRRLKADVVAEQLRRLAGIDWPVEVQDVPAPGVTDGLGWRRRMRYVGGPDGHGGLRRHRSADTVEVPEHGCLIATAALAHPPTDVPVGEEVLGVAGDDRTLWLRSDDRTPPPVTYHAAGRSWRVSGDGFWQTHPGAADVLVDAVLVGLRPRRGETALDLYAGAGLFSGVLAAAGCTVWSVEGSRTAVDDARHNLADVADRVHLAVGSVERAIGVAAGKQWRGGPKPRSNGRAQQRSVDPLPPRADLVVLDPPRSGAGRAVMAAVLARRPRAVAYVACDPAALARDLGTALRGGYDLTALDAFDLFPMTHHVECVAILEPRP